MTFRSASEESASSQPPVRSELDQFVYHISHDARASIRALKDLTLWIGEDLVEADIALPPDTSEHLDLVQRHAIRLDRMVLDLLTYSRVGRRQQVCDVNLETALNEALGQLEVPHDCHVGIDLRATTLTTGERDIVTLWSALAANSFRHGHVPGGSVVFSSEDRGDGVVLRVADSGPGVDPRHHDKIFEMMTTLKPRDEQKGSGLGLPIARKFCNHYGGTLDLKTSPTMAGGVLEAFLPHRHLGDETASVH